jgi:hypothetical protein
MEAADAQRFQLVRCIYQRNKQLDLSDEILDTMLATADDLGEEPPHKRHPSQSYYGAFERHENRLINVAALIKHPAFAEEEEWRALSQVTRDHRDGMLRFRESTARLIPYVEFYLPKKASGAVLFDEVMVGPAPEPALAFTAIDIFLANKSASPTNGQACQVFHGAPGKTEVLLITPDSEMALSGPPPRFLNCSRGN